MNFVGEGLFTDVLAGNRLGLFTILMEPILIGDPRHSSISLRNLKV